MDPMHSLLKRQLQRHFGENINVPKDWQSFIGAINNAYREFDDDRVMLERSLELSSQELLQANSEMRAFFQAIPDLLFRLDQDGTILDIKAGADDDFMFQRQKIFGKQIHDIPNRRIGDQFRKAVAQVAQGKKTVTLEYMLPLRGQESSYEARLVPLFENQIVAIIRNITERKRAEAAIQEQLRLEEQLAKLATTTPGVIHAFRLRPDGTTSFPYANPTIANIYDLKPEDLVEDASRAWERIHPEDAARMKPTIQKSARDLSIWREEFRVQHPQKGQIWVEGCSSPVREPDGSILWHGFLLDITERKQSEERLHRTVSLLQSTLNSTADGVLVVDPAGRIVSFNERFASLWQMPQTILESGDDDAVLARAISQVKEPDAFLKRVRELYATPEAESFDVIEFKDGRVFERYSCPQRLNGKPVGRVWSFRDASERKRAEAALRENAQRMRTLAEASFEGICISENGRILDVNDQFVAMYGYERDELIGREIATLIAPPWRQAFNERVRSNDGTPMEHQCLRKNGSRFECEAQARTIFLGGREVRVSAVRDLTERKQLETQLRQSQKMQAFGQLAAGVAHDFNNILTVIQGNVSLLQMGQLTPAEQTSASAEIFRAAQRAANLTRQLLTFSRRQPLQSQNLDLNEVVANVTKMLRRLIGEDIALETRCASGGAPIHADPGMLEQVLMNLAVNARDAMPKGGRLIVETAPVTLADTTQFTKHVARPGEFVRLSIADTGSGVAPENLPHLFEPFFTTKDVGKGTGLGLATVFGIVEQHQGWIEVESQVNEGTTFHIYFPRLVGNLVNGDSRLTPPEVPGGNETILLVEDETALRRLMQRVLERHGYHIHAAVSGMQALEIWRGHRDEIDLLVTDIIMPDGMNGRELADKLRTDKPGLKIIYCSGYANNLPGKDSPLRHHEDFLEKPFEPVKLLQKVRNCADTE
jgi:two-component system, cell cycle sensor histidine kinase and response regulator CckA